MRKPEQTSEPSIEEILASIRRIIADEGSPTAPVFDQAAPNLDEAGRQQQAHYDPHYEERRYDERRDRHSHQQQAREPQYREREPQYREPQFREREPQYQEREPHFEEPRHGELPARGAHLRGYTPEPQRHPHHDDQRGQHRRGEQYGSDYDFESGAHADFHGRNSIANDFDADDDFHHNGHARNDFDIGDDRAGSNFDPYATHDDFDPKAVRPATGNEDEILELTEDFMVEEESSAVADAPRTNGAHGMSRLDSEPENFAKPDFTPTPETDLEQGHESEFDFALETKENVPVGLEPVPVAIEATVAPLAEDAFSTEGLEGVLSNVVAEMQRLSEGKGLSALLGNSTPQPEASPEPMATATEKPQQRPQNWQPRARHASATPAQRPVWSARRLDSDGGCAPQSASAPQSKDRERSRTSIGTPEDNGFGVPSSGEAATFKPAVQEVTSPQTHSGSASAPTAPTALARNAHLKTTVEEVMPDLPEGDFPPEPGAAGRPHGKVMAEAMVAARAAPKPETGTPEETPELPGDADDEVAAPAATAQPNAVSHPQTVAPVKVAAAAKSIQAPPSVMTAKEDARPVSPPPAQASASTPKSLVEKTAAAAPLPAGLEDGVREMLKPLVAEWLQDNLPRLVEELLREEIRAAGPLAKRGGNKE